MPRYGEWRPLAGNWAAQPELRRHDLVLLHTMAGSLPGTDAYFRDDGYGGTESHFGVGGDGRCWQWQDTTRRAEANREANDAAISIETEDRDGHRRFPRWSGSDVPAWTPEQVARLADLVAWCCRTHDIPCVLVPDSRPGRRGVGFHRIGIDPWRVAGGEKWSTAVGKVCPGDRRVAQVPDVIARARRILAGSSPPTQEDDMPTPHDLAEAVWGRPVRNLNGDVVRADQVLVGTEVRTADVQRQVDELKAEVARLRAAVENR